MKTKTYINFLLVFALFQSSMAQRTQTALPKVEDRLIVNASGVNINAEELWGYVQKLKVEMLLTE